MSAAGIHVVKLGGSLLKPAGLAEMIERFVAWHGAEARPRVVLVVGGGAAADVVRGFDQALQLGEERTHWLAVRAMQLNAHLVAATLRGCVVAGDPQACEREKFVVMDPWEWLTREAAAGIEIPHRWTFTSDSIAAHVATRLKAVKLTLLKSTLPPGDCDPVRAAALGLVDADFPEAAKALPSIEVVNLRSWPATRCVLR